MTGNGMVVWCEMGLEMSDISGEFGLMNRSDAGILDRLSGLIFFRFLDLSFKEVMRLSDLGTGENA